jgi:transposase
MQESMCLWKNQSCICVIGANGKVVREGKVSSEPTALIAWLSEVGLTLTRIGLEAGPLSQWLYAAMRQAGLAVELLERRHVRNGFKTMPVKTDRKDARGISKLMRLDRYAGTAADDNTRRRRHRDTDVFKRDRRPITVQNVESRRGEFRHANAISVRGNRLQRPDFEERRRLGACGTLRGRSPHPDEAA